MPCTSQWCCTAHILGDPEEYTSFHFGYALDFLLGTLDYSPDEPLVPANEADLHLQPSGDLMLKDQYCVIIWNDDKHSIKEVAQLIHDSTGQSLDEAHQIVLRIDKDGCDLVDMNSNIPRLLKITHTISQVDFRVTICGAYDTFQEQVFPGVD